MHSLLHNLKSFAINRPPLVIFTLCITVFAVGALMLAYYMHEEPIKDPDIMDWNDVFAKFSQLDLCVKMGNHVRGKHKSFGLFSWNIDKDRQDVENGISLLFRIKLASVRLKHVDMDVNIFRGPVALQDLGFKDLDSRLQLRVAVDLGPNQQYANCTSDGLCTIISSACVTFSGPVHLLPNTRKAKLCLQRESNTGILSSYLHKGLGESCSGIILEQEYIFDGSLTETLSLKETLLVEIHLMYTSYFLFMVVLVILCIVIAKGHSKPKTVLLDRVATL